MLGEMVSPERFCHSAKVGVFDHDDDGRLIANTQLDPITLIDRSSTLTSLISN